jgi:TusA-related sulfurtransferase
MTKVKGITRHPACMVMDMLGTICPVPEVAGQKGKP